MPWRALQQFSVRPIGWLHGGPNQAICRMHSLYDLTPSRLMAGYAQGIFPTGESNGKIVWHCPAERAIIKTDNVHVSRRLKQYIANSKISITYDRQFQEVMHGCADRKKTWITDKILSVFLELHERGIAHSVEAMIDGQLVGGGYGVAMGDVFFLESMFYRANHASKIAFVHFAEKLRQDGFTTIDCQFLTGHWKGFGAFVVTPEEFQERVVKRLHNPVPFTVPKTVPVAAGLDLPTPPVSAATV